MERTKLGQDWDQWGRATGRRTRCSWDYFALLWKCNDNLNIANLYFQKIQLIKWTPEEVEGSDTPVSLEGTGKGVWQNPPHLALPGQRAPAASNPPEQWNEGKRHRSVYGTTVTLMGEPKKHNRVNVLNATKPYALHNDKMVNFMFYIHHHTQNGKRSHKKANRIASILCLEITQQNMEGTAARCRTGFSWGGGWFHISPQEAEPSRWWHCSVEEGRRRSSREGRKLHNTIASSAAPLNI